MGENRTRYVILIEWIDSLPVGTEFNFNQAVKGVKESSAGKENKEISKQSLSSVILPLCKQGLLNQIAKNPVSKSYCKTKAWNKRKAIKVNVMRLRAKYLKYHPKQF